VAQAAALRGQRNLQIGVGLEVVLAHLDHVLRESRAAERRLRRAHRALPGQYAHVERVEARQAA
jgi:hypothetical protein